MARQRKSHKATFISHDLGRIRRKEERHLDDPHKLIDEITRNYADATVERDGESTTITVVWHFLAPETYLQCVIEPLPTT